MGNLHAISELFTGVSNSEGVSTKATLEDAISSLERQLREAWEQYTALLGNATPGITIDSVEAIQKKYPMLESVGHTGASRNTAMFRYRGLPIRYALTGDSDDNLNEDVIFVSGPDYAFDVMATPESISYKNCTKILGERHALVSRLESIVDNILRTRGGTNIGAHPPLISHAPLLPGGSSPASHPHSGNTASSFADICYGTNRFHPRYGGPAITDAASFTSFLLGLSQWITTGNLLDMYNRTPAPSIATYQYNTELITMNDVRAASQFLRDARTVVQNVLIPASDQRVAEYSQVYPISEDFSNQFKEVTATYLNYFTQYSTLSTGDDYNPAALVALSAIRFTSSRVLLGVQTPFNLFMLLHSAYLILYMKVLSSQAISNAGNIKSSMEHSVFFSAHNMLYSDFCSAGNWSSIPNKYFSPFSGEFIAQWYEAPALLARRCRNRINNQSPGVSAILETLEYTTPGDFSN